MNGKNFQILCEFECLNAKCFVKVLLTIYNDQNKSEEAATAAAAAAKKWMLEMGTHSLGRQYYHKTI